MKPDATADSGRLSSKIKLAGSACSFERWGTLVTCQGIVGLEPGNCSFSSEVKLVSHLLYSLLTLICHVSSKLLYE